MRDRALAALRGLAARSRDVGRAVMWEHTLFSLPFALAAVLAESGGRPDPRKAAWIVLAVVAARTGANAMNRLIDHGIDAANPRTADRHLPSGRLRRRDLWIASGLSGALLLVAAWRLNPLCLALVPVAGALVVGYSYAKRFTWLSHWWLGLACSAAVMGSFLALGGRFAWRYFPLTGAVALWVAGFDVIYALQDIDHDRAAGLRSAPARFGRRGALALAAGSHAGAAGGLVLAGWAYGRGPLWYAGCAAAAGILVAQNAIAGKGPADRIPFAAYRLNQVLSPVTAAFFVLDVYAFPGGPRA